jgi:ring-1,2-phenylacetyl-CoA epoxidase subunit PaaD
MRTRAWDIAASVVDPEIPVLTIEDLGVLRSVDEAGDTVRVELTPTYSGCPAIDAMRDDVRTALLGAGYRHVDVRMILSPAWTTDWMSDDGKRKLAEYGIAAPNGRAPVHRTERGSRVTLSMAVKCPRCDSLDTRELARFGSTSCKALYECRSCLEPFDFFKVL